MKKWIALGGTLVITLVVWGLFIMVVIDIDNLSSSEIDPSQERIDLVNGTNENRYDDDGENEQGDFVSVNQLDEKTEQSDLDVNLQDVPDTIPEVKNGDAIGYGQGVSIDVLLDQLP
ncbi:hypothetical protein CR194_03315 [Salipaludibacillus keqinensis]|uniref:Uncharacterized protein n=1 Tax=Salipaludibacillus keqinensis TaxID=2045207 RepID=A0A323TLE8_9BACI|nr:hypothetical protein [Salipaludibacillus keqinensis]PYZ94577.1 hypothetical protein CR194_03315 [Salipaludibacillus keqinensis]